MIKFEKIKPGMTLYDVRRNRGLSRNKWNSWSVYVIDVDNEKHSVLASWNGNKEEWMHEKRVCKFREKLPKEKASEAN